MAHPQKLCYFGKSLVAHLRHLSSPQVRNRWSQDFSGSVTNIWVPRLWKLFKKFNKKNSITFGNGHTSRVKRRFYICDHNISTHFLFNTNISFKSAGVAVGVFPETWPSVEYVVRICQTTWSWECLVILVHCAFVCVFTVCVCSSVRVETRTVCE